MLNLDLKGWQLSNNAEKDFRQTVVKVILHFIWVPG